MASLRQLHTKVERVFEDAVFGWDSGQGPDFRATTSSQTTSPTPKSGLGPSSGLHIYPPLQLGGKGLRLYIYIILANKII